MTAELNRRDGDCPAGGVFYMCYGFRGCCTIDPCTPDGSCPADKDLTPGRSSSASTPVSTGSLMASATSPTSILTISRTESPATSRPSLGLDITFSLVDPSHTTVVPTASATRKPSDVTSAPKSHTAPVAVVVGAVLGAGVLCALLLVVCLWIRKRRNPKVYKAPSYPSPLVGSDMTTELSGKLSSQFQQKMAALYRAESITERYDTPQLDSREISRLEDGRHDSAGRFVELAAEPLPWPGDASRR